jgi:hypothetical protein
VGIPGVGVEKPRLVGFDQNLFRHPVVARHVFVLTGIAERLRSDQQEAYGRGEDSKPGRL